MKFLYEKGIPLLFAIALAFQELNWFPIGCSSIVPVLACFLVMFLLLCYEKKQWNLLCGICLVAGILVFLLYHQKIVQFEVHHLFVLLFAIQYLVLSILMNQVYMKTGVSTVFLVTAVILRFYDIEIQHWLLFMLLFYTIISCSELIHVRYYKKKFESSRTLGLLPVFCVLLIVCMVLPAKVTPFDWSFVVRPVKSVYVHISTLCEDIYDMVQEEGTWFSYESMGLNSEDDSRLGGNVEQSDRVLLQVKGNRSNGHTIYLNGSISDTYTGTGWMRDAVEEESGASEYQMQKKELAFATELQHFDEVTDEIVMEERTLYIKFGRLRTKTLFYPDYLGYISFVSKESAVEDDTANIAFKRAKKRDYEYRTLYTDVNVNSHYVMDYLKNLDDFQYEDKELRTRALRIQQDYTQLPVELPEQIRTLTEEITDGVQNDYERMEAICQYLKTLEYTRKVDEVPENADFVADFLFHSRKGYCTYFATAAAVMGRCLGIPTRYVEGVIVPKDCELVDGYYQLDGTCVHAWCESYFEGFGWVRFDPTPGYGTTETDTVWQKKVFTNYYEEEVEENTASPEVTMDIESGESRSGETHLDFWLLSILLTVAVVVLLILLRLHHNRKNKRTKEEQCRAEFSLLLFYCRKLGFVLGDSETLMEFVYRVQSGITAKEETASMISNGALEEAVEVYLKLRYGEGIALDEDLLKLRRVVIAFQKIYLSTYGRFRYQMVHLESLLPRT